MTLLLLFNQPPYYRVLLNTAQRLIAQNEPEIAVVTAQMACEIYTEQMFTAMFKKRGVDFLEEAIDELLPNYNLGNEKVRKIYIALCGDMIQNASFWLRFKEAVKLRNGAVHGGNRISKQQAEDACQAFSELVQHIEAVLRKP